MHVPGPGGQAGALSSVSAAVGYQDGDLDPQPPSQAFHSPPTKEPVPHLEIQANQQEDDSSVLSGKYQKHLVLPRGFKYYIQCSYLV